MSGQKKEQLIKYNDDDRSRLSCLQGRRVVGRTSGQTNKQTYIGKINTKAIVPSRPQYLSDSAGEKLDPNIKRSALVDGYKHRKNRPNATERQN